MTVNGADAGGVLFLIHANNRVTIRRCLAVAHQLAGRGIRSSFVLLDADDTSFIRKELERMPFDVEITVDAFKPPPDRIRGTVLIPDAAGRPLFRPRPNSLSFDQPPKLPSVLDAVGFDPAAALFPVLPNIADAYVSFLAAAREMIARLAPDCLVFDIEFDMSAATLIAAARERGAVIVSMQHGAGNCVHASRMPRLADYYVAYNLHNVASLANMGVPFDRIWLTGVPDPPSRPGEPAPGRQALRQRLGLPAERLVVLIALRPVEVGVFDVMRWMNEDLLHRLETILADTPEVLVVIRPHPRDIGTPAAVMAMEERRPGWSRLSDPGTPVAEWLGAADVVITFVSSLVPEAIESGVATVVIDCPDGGDWPPWGEYGAYTSVQPAGIDGVLHDLRTGRFVGRRLSGERRAAFLAQFGITPTPAAAARIAAAISGSIERSTTERECGSAFANSAQM